MDDSTNGSTRAAVEAYRRGFTPIPIRAGDKRPYGSSWTQLSWHSEEQVETAFTGWVNQGVTNVGLLLGERGGRLVDVDLDHPMAMRLADIMLPKTSMMSGRRSRYRSHYWYVVDDVIPQYRKLPMGTGGIAVEMRSTSGHQTVIPPSVHPSGEEYTWVGEPWGGRAGPAKVNARELERQVLSLALLANLADSWPEPGERHDAYLALAGGMLRFGDGVHPYWERNLPAFIHVLAAVTNDEDGGDARVAEVVDSTLRLLRRSGSRVTGFGRLAEMIGNESADLVKRRKADIESLMDFKPEPIRRETDSTIDLVVSTLDPEIRNPLEERLSTWDRVDMEPYVLGRIVMPEPSVLIREDGKGLMYPGRVNSLYGLSESGKSWIAMLACLQEMGKGEKVMYLDFEDSPEGTWHRMKLMGAGADDMGNFAYVHPEEPLADMMHGRFSARPDDIHLQRSRIFKMLLETFDPTLVVVDGMTTLYNSHGLDTNAAADTDVISSWLRSLARNGRTTVLVIDHTGKGGDRGSSPIGAHHKIAMIQGTALQVDPRIQPMPGAVGEVDILVYKDRPGAVRVISAPLRPGQRTQLAATAVIDSTTEGMTVITLKMPDPDDVALGGDPAMERAAQRAEREALEKTRRSEMRVTRDLVLGVYEGEIGRSFTKERLLRQLPENTPHVDAVVAELVEDGRLVKFPAGRGTTYTLN